MQFVWDPGCSWPKRPGLSVSFQCEVKMNQYRASIGVYIVLFRKLDSGLWVL